MTSGYILHTSRTFFLPSILKDKKLKAIKPSDTGQKGVYGLYLSKNIKYEGSEWYYGSWMPPFKGKVIYCIDPSILQKDPFIVCPRIQYGQCDPVMTNDTMLSVNKLENFINNQLKRQIIKKDTDIGFIYTHEIVILGSIPLDYIKQIIVSPAEINNVRELVKKAGYVDKISIIKKPMDWHNIF